MVHLNAAAAAAQRAAVMADRFFRQPIDRFRPSLGTFDQRYYVRDSYVKTGATSTPLILFLGGEAALDGPPAPGSFVDALARRHGALLVALEHRFYGRSIPVSYTHLTLPTKA